VPSHSADRSSYRAAPASSPALEGAPATATDALDVADEAHGASGAYIYGYDVAGNPTLTDASNYNSAGGSLAD
jgi:hypothetical protein